MYEGLIAVTPKEFVVLLIGFLYFSLFSIVFYLHKEKSHGVIKLREPLRSLVQFWIWITSGVNTCVWAKIHQDHHDYEGTEKDIHSIAHGSWYLLVYGLRDYFIREDELLKSTSLDYREYSFLEKNIYFKYRKSGIFIFLLVLVLILGPTRGLVLFSVPFFAGTVFFANIFNAISHSYGYIHKGGTSKKTSARNIFPIGLLLLGEELHYNHHSAPYALNNARTFWEFDIGFYSIRVLKFFHLADEIKERKF